MATAKSHKPPRIGLLASENPPHVRHLGVIDEVLKLIPSMQDQKNTWFRIGEFYSVHAVGGMRERLTKRVPECQWTTRVVDGGSILWGRYTGKR